MKLGGEQRGEDAESDGGEGEEDAGLHAQHASGAARQSGISPVSAAPHASSAKVGRAHAPADVVHAILFPRNVP